MGYSYENWEIFEKIFDFSEKNLKKFKNIKNPKIILFFEKEPYFARSATSPWVPPCFFIFLRFFYKKALFYELISKVSETFKSSRKHCLVQNFV